MGGGKGCYCDSIEVSEAIKIIILIILLLCRSFTDPNPGERMSSMLSVVFLVI